MDEYLRCLEALWTQDPVERDGAREAGRDPEAVQTVVRGVTDLGYDEPAGLRGKRVLISAGPTREFIDPARFISNPSSGRMGFALAAEAKARGAAVVVVAGPLDDQLQLPPVDEQEPHPVGELRAVGQLPGHRDPAAGASHEAAADAGAEAAHGDAPDPPGAGRGWRQPRAAQCAPA